MCSWGLSSSSLPWTLLMWGKNYHLHNFSVQSRVILGTGLNATHNCPFCKMCSAGDICTLDCSYNFGLTFHVTAYKCISSLCASLLSKHSCEVQQTWLYSNYCLANTTWLYCEHVGNMGIWLSIVYSVCWHCEHNMFLKFYLPFLVVSEILQTFLGFCASCCCECVWVMLWTV